MKYAIAPIYLPGPIGDAVRNLCVERSKILYLLKGLDHVRTFQQTSAISLLTRLLDRRTPTAAG